MTSPAWAQTQHQCLSAQWEKRRHQFLLAAARKRSMWNLKKLTKVYDSSDKAPFQTFGTFSHIRKLKKSSLQSGSIEKHEKLSAAVCVCLSCNAFFTKCWLLVSKHPGPHCEQGSNSNNGNIRNHLCPILTYCIYIYTYICMGLCHHVSSSFALNIYIYIIYYIYLKNSWYTSFRPQKQ